MAQDFVTEMYVRGGQDSERAGKDSGTIHDFRTQYGFADRMEN